MWELDCKESWVPRNWCFWTVVLEKTLESPLDSKEIQPVHPKGNQPWIFFGRTDAEAETPILWPPDSFEKTLVVGKTEGRRRRGRQRMKWLDGITDSMHVSLSELRELVMGREVSCDSWGRKESDTTEQLNWTELLRRKVMTNLDSILKSRDITLSTKVCLVKAMVFPVVMHGCESWTIKKAECWRTDAFELWCWLRPIALA